MIEYKGKIYENIRDVIAASMLCEPMDDDEAHAQVTLEEGA